MKRPDMLLRGRGATLRPQTSRFWGVSLAVLWCAVMGIFPSQARAAGLLTPKDGSLPALEIKDHRVEVIVEDGYAITTVEQVFHNPHQQDLEAVYSFPVPDKAAVGEFTMWIDGKPVHGEVLEREQARKVYEEQKAQQNNAGITEKNDHKTFEISVSPVRAGQDTRIRLGYFQPAQVDTGIGRYVYPLEEGGVDEEALAFWTTQDRVTGTFSFDLLLRSDYPVDLVRLPNHPQAQVAQNSDVWAVHLDNHMTTIPVAAQSDPALTINNGDDLEAPPDPQADPAFRLDKDIVVYFRHQEDLPGSVDLLAYKKDPGGRGTFMLTVTPGMDLQPITEGRDWVFILDISGSMQGKYATLAEGVARTLKSMDPNDRFRIIVFNNSARELTRGYVTATPANVQTYIEKVTTTRPNNGTNLYAGLQLGLKKLDADRTSSLILVTDGVANVGVTQQKHFIELIKKHDVRLFTFIMGNSANRPLLTALTKASHGFALNVSNSDDIIGKILLAKSKVTHEALHGVSVKISGVKTTDVTPKAIHSLYRGQQLIVLGHYYGGGPAQVKLKGRISGEDKTYATTFDFPDVDAENPELERLWAYAVIEDLSEQMQDFGEQADMKQSMIDLGVEYGLVTDYTSMVIVEEEVFDELGIERRNHKRLQEEYAARSQRQQRQVKSRRADTQQPMFSGHRPTLSGTGLGAMDPVSLLLFSPLLWGLRKRRKTKC